MTRYKVEVEDPEGNKIPIIENFAVIEKVNGFEDVAVVESPVTALFIADSFKIPSNIFFSNFRKNINGTLTLLV